MRTRRVVMAQTGLWVLGVILVLGAGPATAQDAKTAHKPFKDQSSSEISLSAKDDAETIEIKNTSYEMCACQAPGRPSDEMLVLKKQVQTKEVLGDMGVQATTTIEAWRLGSDLTQKPIYSINVEGLDPRTIDEAVVEVNRGLEEVAWWSIYSAGTGQHLFDTYVPLVRLSISRDTLTLRYVGLEVPPDDVADTRLKDPHVVAVVSYASAQRVIREALLTSDDPKQAAQLRSFADEERSATAGETGHSIKISFSQSFPSAPATQSVVIPIAKDDLDLTHAQLPPHLHLAAWKR